MEYVAAVSWDFESFGEIVILRGNQVIITGAINILKNGSEKLKAINHQQKV